MPELDLLKLNLRLRLDTAIEAVEFFVTDPKEHTLQGAHAVWSAFRESDAKEVADSLTKLGLEPLAERLLQEEYAGFTEMEDTITETTAAKDIYWVVYPASELLRFLKRLRDLLSPNSLPGQNSTAAVDSSPTTAVIHADRAEILPLNEMEQDTLEVSDSKASGRGNAPHTKAAAIEDPTEDSQDSAAGDAAVPAGQAEVGDAVSADGSKAGVEPAKNPTDNKWPPDNGLHFRPLEFAYQGKAYRLTGLPHRLFEVIATARKNLHHNEIVEKVWTSQERNPERSTVRGCLARLRAILHSQGLGILAERIKVKDDYWSFLD